ncbi:MAG: restriction endonuclease [Alphaproteobacteria bacterium]|nr:restriction endonuclease [Alphaproteobacteria bacterium]MDA8031536.1 restriction endonuclease [Alphaproteobacteria bacterium]
MVELNFDTTVADVISTYRAVVENVEIDAASDAERAYGGVVRAKKGGMVEKMAAQMVSIAWNNLGKSRDDLKLSQEKVAIHLQEDYLNNLPPDVAADIRSNLQEYVYNCKVDLHLLVKDKFVLGIECKAFAENAMYKRILADFHLLKMQHPNLHCVLLQLESQLGGDYSDISKATITGSKSSRTLESYFPEAAPHVITLLKGERNVKKPIHKPEHYKELKPESVERAIKVLEGIFSRI